MFVLTMKSSINRKQMYMCRDEHIHQVYITICHIPKYTLFMYQYKKYMKKPYEFNLTSLDNSNMYFYLILAYWYPHV